MTNSFFLLHRLLTRLFFFSYYFFYVATLLYGFYSFRFAVATFLFRASYNIFFYVSPLLLELSTSKFRRVRSLDGLLSLSLSLSLFLLHFFFFYECCTWKKLGCSIKYVSTCFSSGGGGRRRVLPIFGMLQVVGSVGISLTSGRGRIGRCCIFIDDSAIFFA